MIDEAQAIWAEAETARLKAEEHQRNSEYLLTVLNLFLDERELHLAHTRSFNSELRIMLRGVKEEQKREHFCRRIEVHLWKRYLKEVRKCQMMK